MMETPPAVRRFWVQDPDVSEDRAVEVILAADYERLERELVNTERSSEEWIARYKQLERDLAAVRAALEDLVSRCGKVDGYGADSWNAAIDEAQRLLAGRGKSQIFPSSDHYDDHLDDDVLEEL